MIIGSIPGGGGKGHPQDSKVGAKVSFHPLNKLKMFILNYLGSIHSDQITLSKLLLLHHGK